MQLITEHHRPLRAMCLAPYEEKGPALPHKELLVFTSCATKHQLGKVRTSSLQHPTEKIAALPYDRSHPRSFLPTSVATKESLGGLVGKARPLLRKRP